MLQRPGGIESDPTDDPRIAPPTRRLRLAQAFAFAGLLAACVAAIGPAERVSTTYSWPPSSLSGEPPSQLSYTPLLLSQIPEAVSARLPCRTPALVGAKTPITLFGTARDPERVGGLLVSRNAAGITVGLGTRVLARLPVPTGETAQKPCAYRLLMHRGRWSISGGPDRVDLSGAPGVMPVVTGLFSELDLRSRTAPSVTVTTMPHMTRATTRQTMGWVIAGLATLASLLLLAFDRWPEGNWHRARGIVVRTSASAHPADMVVGAVLVGWWVLSPAHWDDGWVMARQDGFSTTRGFSNYYDSFGANLPNGYWLEWVQHWLTQSSNLLLVLRIPALVCLVATWIVCRWTLGLIRGSSGISAGRSTWILACGFLAGALAWGMTLRPEPITALLVVGVMACAIRFFERQASAPLVVAAVLIPLAVTGHHAGVVAIAPLLAVGRPLLKWIRFNPAAATALATTVFASLLVFAFVGSDVGQKGLDAQALRTYGVPDAWFDELRRYGYLSEAGGVGGGTPLRRASFALLALAVLAYTLRRQRAGRTPLDIPATSLAFALALLFFVPTKWPHHFGALIGVAAVAVASETLRLREDAAQPRSSRGRPLLAVAIAVIATAWASGPRESWTILDLRSLEWRLGFEQRLSLSIAAAVLPLLVLGVVAVLIRARGGSARGQPTWHVAQLTAPLLAVPLIAFTAAVLVTDAAKTNTRTSPPESGESPW